jgi:hypothetical protein
MPQLHPIQAARSPERAQAERMRLPEPLIATIKQCATLAIVVRQQNWAAEITAELILVQIL